MIVVAGQIPVKPEKREEAVAAALEMAVATQTEPGCITYDFYASLADPNLFHVFEIWEDAESLAAHGQTPHMATFRQKLPALVAGAGSVKRYEVGAVSDL